MRRLAVGVALCLSWLSPAEAMALPADGKAVAADAKKLPGRPGEPGSGVALDKRIRPSDSERLKAPMPRRPNDDAEAAAVSDMEQLEGRYEAAFEAMAHTLGQQFILEAAEGRHALEANYTRKVRDHEAKARKLRALAIERYREFLKLHPDDATWTPEIMFRLAELYFETSSERLARQEDAFQKQLAAYQEELEKNPDAQPPPGPNPEYDDSIALYRDLALRFPRYVYGDAALYMMGTLSYEMEHFDESRQAFLALSCSNKFSTPLADGSNIVSVKTFTPGDYGDCVPLKDDSAFAAEAWLRVGEIHYDLDELDPALEAYAQAAADPDGDLYDEALIRMAWTLYLKRAFPQAAEKFDEFVRYADAHKGEARADGAVALRDEGVKYLAKTYVEEDWDLDGRRDRVAGFERLDRDYRGRGDERHVPEVYAALGDLLAETTDFTDAIRIWEVTLSRWPLAAAAPSIQLRIMQAYEALQDPARTVEARDKLATNYLKGTKWFYANEDDADSIEAALAIAEEALVATAVDHHVRAQELRASGDPKANDEYLIAARAYEAYLERFPDTPTSYDYRYAFAETLFYSGQYLPAAEQYANVRDSNLTNRLQEDAASGTVSAYEAYIDEERQAGRMVYPEMPKAGMEGPFDQELVIPAVVASLQEAYDRFAGVRPDSEQTPSMMYLSGELSQRYMHFDDAERRFTRVLEDHCADNVAINAGTAIIDAHIVREDLKGAQEWTETLLSKGCGSGEEATKFAGELKSIGNAVRFQEATLLLEAGEYEAAADRYVALVDQSPDDPDADRALNNAAFAYENIGRFQSAAQTYERIYTNYPDSEFADDALLRTGFNHSRFFQFDDAVKSYLVLAEDERYKDSEHREVALKNAAGLLDSLQEYKRSSAMYQRYASKTEDQAEKADATFRAAEVLSKTADHTATIAAYQTYLGQFSSDASQSERVVEATLRLGQAYAATGDRKRAEAYYRETVAQFDSKGLQAATDAADFPAQAQFELAEYALSDIVGQQLRGTGKKLEGETKALFDALVVAVKAYDNVFPYRRIEWVLAAMYRRGRAFEEVALRVREAPVPGKLKAMSEPWFAYKDIIDQFANRSEEKALVLYVETVKRGKEFNIANDWTRQARERLNIYMPEEYPLLRRPALDLQLEDRR
jgi:TolA-binding protein